MPIASDGCASPTDLPRERLLAAGPRALSDAELVALEPAASPHDARRVEARP